MNKYLLSLTAASPVIFLCIAPFTTDVRFLWVAFLIAVTALSCFITACIVDSCEGSSGGGRVPGRGGRKRLGSRSGGIW